MAAATGRTRPGSDAGEVGGDEGGGWVEFVGIADIHGGFQVRYLTKSKKYAEKAPRLCASVRCFGNRTF